MLTKQRRKQNNLNKFLTPKNKNKMTNNKTYLKFPTHLIIQVFIIQTRHIICWRTVDKVLTIFQIVVFTDPIIIDTTWRWHIFLGTNMYVYNRNSKHSTFINQVKTFSFFCFDLLLLFFCCFLIYSLKKNTFVTVKTPMGIFWFFNKNRNENNDI